MSITLFQKENGNLHGEVYIEKDSKLYFVRITQDRFTVYKNYFISQENAKRALQCALKRLSENEN